MQRRDVLKGLVVAGAAVVLQRTPLAAPGPALVPGDAGAQLAALERQHGGRLGVAILDTGSGAGAAHRGDERFLMCSTFKLLLVAAVLARVDAGQEQPGRRIVYGHDALLEWAPVTSRHVGAPGMTVAELCEAAITLSDNTAANLLLAQTGGPAAVTRHVRGLGDPATRLDRTEPALNRPDGDQDTTTPLWMLRDLNALLLGDALLPRSRRQLTDWLLQCQTGKDSLRAGLPLDWSEGDKTGSSRTASNDVAIAWPPGGKPVLVAAYYDNPRLEVATRKVVLAQVGLIAARVHH